MQKEFPMKLTRDDLYACGRVAAWSSMLDTTMEVAIWAILGLPRPAARQITHGMNADRKREWLTVLASAPSLTTEQGAELAAILALIRDVLTDRNRVVHGLWHIGPDGTTWAAKYSEKGNLTFHHPLDVTLIWPIADSTKNAARRLARWVNALDPRALASAFPEITPDTKPIGQIQCRQSPPKARSTKHAMP